MASSRQPYDCAVVGLGPSGVAMAGAALRQGLTCVAVEGKPLPVWDYGISIEDVQMGTSCQWDLVGPDHLDDPLSFFNYKRNMKQLEGWYNDTPWDQAKRKRIRRLEFNFYLQWCVRTLMKESSFQACFDSPGKVHAENGLWHLQTARGFERARALIVATGFVFREPASFWVERRLRGQGRVSSSEEVWDADRDEYYERHMADGRWPMIEDYKYLGAVWSYAFDTVPSAAVLGGGVRGLEIVIRTIRRVRWRNSTLRRLLWFGLPAGVPASDNFMNCFSSVRSGAERGNRRLISASLEQDGVEAFAQYQEIRKRFAIEPYHCHGDVRISRSGSLSVVRADTRERVKGRVAAVVSAMGLLPDIALYPTLSDSWTSFIGSGSPDDQWMRLASVIKTDGRVVCPECEPQPPLYHLSAPPLRSSIASVPQAYLQSLPGKAQRIASKLASA